MRGAVKELKEIVFTELSAFVEEAEERGFVTSEAIEEFVVEQDLGEDELLELRGELERREIRIDEASAEDELDLSYDVWSGGGAGSFSFSFSCSSARTSIPRRSSSLKSASVSSASS